MYHYYDIVVNDDTGVPIDGAGLQVYTLAGVLQPIFSDNSGTPISGNIAISDGGGFHDFYVAGGVYDLQFSIGGASARRILRVNLDDANTVRTDLAANTGAAGVGTVQTGTGAVNRTVEAELRDIISRSDYDTLANAWAAAGFKPLFDPTTGKLFLNTDPSALNYSTSRAGFVFQHRDTANAASNELPPGAVMQFYFTGNGVVNAGIEQSQTVWLGQYNFTRKNGDGSGHCYTATGELGAYGPGAYNELGLFQGTGTNLGSNLGTISGVEMLLQDSPDGGATSYNTKMQAVVGRIAQFYAGARKSHCFTGSSEGTVAPAAILGGNTQGLASWQRGFDFQGLTFTTGQFGLAPNNTYLAWLKAAGGTVPVIGLSSGDDVTIAAATTTNRVNITNSALATRFAVDNDANDAALVWVGGVLKRVTEGAANSGGAGFKYLKVPN